MDANTRPSDASLECSGLAPLWYLRLKGFDQSGARPLHSKEAHNPCLTSISATGIFLHFARKDNLQT